MKKVNILSLRRDRISEFFLYPLRKNRSLLREKGYDVNIIEKPTEKNLNCDILGLSSKYFSKWWWEPERVFQFIASTRKKTNKIIWFDLSDSTGVTHFELLPEIDLYLKKQLLKDQNLYTKKFYGDRIFSDFYHQKYGVEDEQDPYHSKPLDLKLSHKVALSWHVGLGDMHGDILPGWSKYFRDFLPPRYPNSFASTLVDRPIDFMFRGSRFYSRNTICFHRSKMGEILDQMNHLNRALKGRVSITEYKNEMRKSKTVISPFGWGEIGVRDFEAWIYGACLVKPDMSFMETWPNVFIENETYLPLSWSFESLAERIDEILASPETLLQVAKQGQEQYRKMISPEGMEKFSDWFIQQIEI